MINRRYSHDSHDCGCQSRFYFAMQPFDVTMRFFQLQRLASETTAVEEEWSLQTKIWKTHKHLRKKPLKLSRTAKHQPWPQVFLLPRGSSGILQSLDTTEDSLSFICAHLRCKLLVLFLTNCKNRTYLTYIILQRNATPSRLDRWCCFLMPKIHSKSEKQKILFS